MTQSHRVIARQVQSLRKGRGWSAQRLADEMAKVGIPWDRSIVANLENGRRAAVSVEEFLALAYVLDIAPVHLLVPIDDPAPLEVVGGVSANPAVVRSWIRGQDAIGQVDVRRYASQVPAEEFGPDRSGQVSSAYGRAALTKALAEHGFRMVEERDDTTGTTVTRFVEGGDDGDR